jgi:prepilin-type N-terminal cleavage/methylation domain-containing protein
MSKRVATVKTLTQQEGFTLVELLVAMVLSMVVFGATLTILDAYNNQSAISTQLNDAQDRARTGIDRIVWGLRNIASPLTTPKLLERATPYDIVFQTVGPQQYQTVQGQQVGNVSGDERVRYCLPNDSPASSSTEVVHVETQTWNTSTPPASPWSSDPTVTLPCPDTPLPSGVSLSTAATGVTNRYSGSVSHPVFSYNNGTLDPGNLIPAADLPKVTSVQIDMFVNPTPTYKTFHDPGFELRSSAFLRNQTHAPVAQFTSTSTGGGGVLLNGGTSYSPDGYSLLYNWACVSSGCPDASALAASTDGLVPWHPGPGTYQVQLTVTDPNGLSNTTTPPNTVTVTP